VHFHFLWHYANDFHAGNGDLFGRGAQRILDAVARDGIQYALGPTSEEVTVPGVEVVGVMPKEVEMHFDYTAAVTAYAAQPEEAAAFMAYITRPQALAVWKGTGLEPLP
jgi:molybdate transport system substrate-binding protein